MNLIKQNLLKIKKRISLACNKFKKNAKNITLIAVSKNQSINNIKKAIKNKQFFFGENYVQEAILKIKELSFAIKDNIVWHFIGKLQSNKAKLVAKYFDWCHTVDSLKTANKLNKYRLEYQEYPLNILIQININNEKNKSGINNLVDLNLLIDKITKLKNLKFRGLMTIPKIQTNPLVNFLKISKINEDLKKKYSQIDRLSMGMSQDFESAIQAGSNMLRIGTAIFGKRKK